MILTVVAVLGLLVGSGLLYSGVQQHTRATGGPDPLPESSNVSISRDEALSLQDEHRLAIDQLLSERRAFAEQRQSIPEGAQAPSREADGSALGSYVRTEEVPQSSYSTASRVIVPSIYVDAGFREAGIEDGAMTLPVRDMENVTYLGRNPGDGSGQGYSIVAGHVSYYGVHGALYLLSQTRPGALVTTTDAEGNRQDWRVYKTQTIKKAKLPDEIFSQSGPRTLVLVTCGGTLTQVPGGRVYDSNVLVYATPVPGDGSTTKA